MAQGSGGYGGPNFSQIENDLRNIALQFTSILSVQMQLRASVDTWRNLERELSLARAAAEGTRQQFLQMEAAARNFALSTTFSASQVANAFYSLASAGMTATEALAASTGVILLAQATLTDLGEASDVVSSTLAQFNLTAAESYRVGNLFVASTNASLSTVPKLAFALRQVGPIASQMNLSLEQTVGILDKLFDAGLRGEQAGTALRNAMARIVDPAGQGRMLLENLGINTLDQKTGQMRGFIDIMKDLSKLDLSVSDVSNIAGVEAASGFTTLLKELKTDAPGATSALEAHIAAISGTNAAYKQAVIQMETLDGTMNILGNAFNDMRIQLGQMLTPLIANFTDLVVDLDQALSNMDLSTKLNYVSWTLWGVGAIAAVKFMGMLVTSAVEVTKAVATVNIAIAELRALSAAAAGAGLLQTLALGAPAAASLAAGLGTIVAATAGLAGVAIAIGLIGKAIMDTNEAEQKARLDEGLQRVYQRAGRTDNLTADQRSRLLDQRDYSASADKQYANLQNMRNIDPGTGVGSGTQFQMISEYVKERQRDIDTLRTQLTAIDNDYARLLPTFQKSINEHLSNALSQGFFDGTSSEQRLFLNITDQFRLSGSDAEAKRAADELSNQYNRAFDQFANATDANVRAASQKYGQQMIAIFNKTGASESEKAKYRERIQQNMASFAAMDDESLLALRDNMRKQQESLRDRLSDAVPDVRGGIIASAIGEVFDKTQAQMILDEEGIQARKEALRAQIESATSRIGQATEDMGGLMTGMVRETAINLLTASKLSQDQRTNVVGEINKALNTDNGGWLAPVFAKLKETSGNEVAAAATLRDLLIQRRLGTSQALNDAFKASLATPVVDQLGLNAFARETRIKELEAQKALIEATGVGANLEGVIRDLNNERGKVAVSDVTGELLDLLKKNSAPEVTQIINSLNEYQRQEVESQINKIASANNEGDKERFAQQLDAYFGGMNLRWGPEQRRAVREYSRRLKADQTKLEADLQNELNQNESRSVKLTPTEEAQKALLDLPSEQELSVQRRKLQMQAEYAISQYLNLPIVAINQGLDAAALDFEEKVSSLNKKYRGYFTDKIAKGLGEAVTSPALQDAFSGRLLSEAMAKGQTQFNGQVFTKEFLQTSEGLQTFVDAVESEFTRLMGNAPAAADRAVAARNMLNEMAKDIGATIDEFGANAEVLELKRRSAQTSIDEFMRNFNAQRIVDDFQRMLQTEAVNFRNNDINIDLAVNARVAQVELDASSATSKMRESFENYFKNANIPVSFNPKTQKFELISDDNVYDPLKGAATALDGAAGKLSAAADKLMGGGTVGGATYGGAGLDKEIVSFFQGKGVQLAIAQGIAAGIQAESGSDPTIRNKTSGAFGLGQHLGSRRTELFQLYGKDGIPTKQEQLEFIWGELSGKVSGVTQDKGGASVLSSTNAADALKNYIIEFMRPAKGHETTSDISRGMTALGAPTMSGTTATQSDAFNKAFGGDFLGQNAAALEELNNERQREVDEINRRMEAERAYWESVKQFEKDNPIIAAAEAAKAAGDQYDNFVGKVRESEKVFADLAKTAAEANIKMATMRFVNGDESAMGDVAGLVADRERATIAAEMSAALAEQQRLHAQGIIDAGQLSEAEATITEYYRLQAEYAGQSVASRREILELQAQMIQQQAEMDGQGTTSDMFAGARSAALRFAAEIPTVFETSAGVAKQAFQGLSNSIAAVMVSGGKGIKGILANMLSAMSNLIAQMLASYAVMQIIAALPGGRALLAAMDAAASVSSVVSAGVSAGALVVRSSNGSLPGISGNTPGYGTAYAEGGIHTQYGRNTMGMGGVRPPFNAVGAIFGEGQYPEAFIPMVDRKTVPVRFDANGNPYIPLPSGENIPVSIAGKFAMGGIGGIDANSLSKPYSRASAQVADKLLSGQRDAVSPVRSSRSSTGQTGAVTNYTDIGGIHLTIAGNATQDDAGAISEAIVDMVMKALDARDQQKAIDSIRRGRMVQGENYGGNI